MRLYRDERQYLHMPFWGLAGATPQYRFGDSEYANMEVATGYVPPAGWTAPAGVTGDPDWYRVLIAGPDATSNPVGTVVLTESVQVFFRVVAGDEIDVLPDTPEWVLLVGAAA